MDDFLDRFVTRLKQSPARLRTSNSLHKFQRAWDDILVEHQLESNWTRGVDQTDIPNALQQILDILVKEQAVMRDGLETGRCTELFLNDDVLGYLVKISEDDVPVGFRSEVIHFLSSLISLLDGKILFQSSIHRATLKLMRSCLTDKDKKYEDDMLELEYNIAYKIHELPPLLEIFFTKNFVPKNVPAQSVVAAGSSSPARAGSPAPGSSLSSRPATGQQFEFPLFDHLMQYVHLEGQRGDFARTSCMFLLELAKGDLQQYIATSDFPTITIAGLGGLFSQLPLSLPAPVPPGSRPGYAWQTFTKDMESFLNLLQFVQQVLLKCPSPIITAAMLKQLQTTFLDNAVTASLTTASDFNGTTVATLFYIQQMLDSIREDQLSELFVNFLLKGDDETDHAESSNGDMELQVRDILISKLNSLSEDVVTGILRFFHALLEGHSSRALHLLIERLPPRKASSEGISPLLFERSSPVIMDVRQHVAVVSRYFALVQAEAPSAGQENSLEAYLQDAEKMVASYGRVMPKGATLNLKILPRSSSLTPTPKSPTPPLDHHTLDPRVLDQLKHLSRDPTLSKFLKKFSTFLSHSMQINLALTGVLSQLATAPEPVLYTYLFSGDLLLGEGVTSLHTVILRLRKEIDDKKRTVINYDEKLERTREELFTGFSGDADPSDGMGRRTGTNRKRWTLVDGTPDPAAELDLEAEFLRNVVVLEEFVKELLAVLVMHGSREYDEVSFL
ncbi:hypothetical protein HK104_008833 [Borealophlyctis nickersoniae]|nr:hypothetical protein HK104_008833 [Borealophlyctis nickersoniae]